MLLGTSKIKLFFTIYWKKQTYDLDLWKSDIEHSRLQNSNPQRLMLYPCEL